MGLNLLLKNSKIRVDKRKKDRKTKFLMNLLDELWDTQNNISLTCKNVVEFTNNVLENSENFRSTRLFPVRDSKRIVIPKLLEKKSLQVEKHKIERITEKVKNLQDDEIYIQFKEKYSILSKASYFEVKRLLIKDFEEKKKSILN